MNGFWWWSEQRVAGMGRPGFNRRSWFELPVAEAMVFSWLGKLPPGPARIADLEAYLSSFCLRLAPFYGMSRTQMEDLVTPLSERQRLLEVLEQIGRLTGVIDQAGWDASSGEPHVELSFSAQRLTDEISFLRQQGVRHLVRLIEEPFDHDALDAHFDVHHLPIDDLASPSRQQAEHAASLVEVARREGNTIVFHCLAGIGRTTTLILAAHLILGESMNAVLQRAKNKNPTFVLAGAQAEFIHSLDTSPGVP